MYALVGDSQRAITHMRKHPTALLEFQYNPDFELLKSDLAFMVQLQSLKLEDNTLEVKNAAFQNIKNSLLVMD